MCKISMININMNKKININMNKKIKKNNKYLFVKSVKNLAETNS